MSSSASESAAVFPDCHSRMTQEELKQFLEFMEADELSSDEDPSVGNDVESSHNLDELAKERQMEEAKMARPIPVCITTVRQKSWQETHKIDVGKKFQTKAEFEICVGPCGCAE